MGPHRVLPCINNSRTSRKTILYKVRLKIFYTIYRITNKINQKYYIGKHQTKNLDDGYMGSGKLLKRAIKKYGLENFYKEILFIFSSEEEMNAKEKELVIVSEETYNLCEGGKGGFGYINENKLNINGKYFGGKVSGSILANKIKTDCNFKKLWLAKMISSRKIAITIGFSGRKHNEETKNIMAMKAKERLRDPTKNSQYGTCWITNGQENKKIKKEDVDKWFELGYSKGRN